MAIGTTFKLSFDGRAVRRGLASVKSSVASIARAGVGIAKLGVALTAMGIAGAAAIGAVAYKINAIGEAAVTSENRVKSIVKQMGLFGDEADNVADRMIALAKVTARQTGIDEKIIELTQAKLATFKELASSADEAGGAFDRATMAAIDMAAAGFGTAEENATQLGKAMNDPVRGMTALRRSGVAFNEEQQKVIKNLVETGQLMKAQGVMLSAIENDNAIKNVARDTADASQKIKVSLGQVVQAFAKPFSTGFNSLPSMLDEVFPQLIERAKQYGQLFANAISDAIQGNFDKFVAAGKLIGDIMGAAATAAFQSAASNIFSEAVQKLTGTRRVEIGADGGRSVVSSGGIAPEGGTFSELLEAQLILRDISKQIKDVANGAQGLVPGSGGRFRFAAPNEPTSLRDASGNRVVEVLNKIERNTSEGAKM